jgi:DNA topoisomerase-3
MLLAVDARQELDLKVGVAFTRFQTRFFQGKYGNLDSAVISYGPCQTPTLTFCVQRHDLIQRFTPETFWTLAVTVTKSNAPIKLTWERGRLFDKHVTTMLLNTLQKDSEKGAK